MHSVDGQIAVVILPRFHYTARGAWLAFLPLAPFVRNRIPHQRHDRSEAHIGIGVFAIGSLQGLVERLLRPGFRRRFGRGRKWQYSARPGALRGDIPRTLPQCVETQIRFAAWRTRRARDARATRTPASEARTAPDVTSTPSASPSTRSGDGGNSEEDGLSRDHPRIPSAPGSPSNKPDLSLDTLRQRARDLAAQGTGPRTVLPFPTSPKPPPKTKAQQAFDKALQRPDCKDAYADMGLAAVLPLVWDSVTNKGCKW